MLTLSRTPRHLCRLKLGACYATSAPQPSEPKPPNQQQSKELAQAPAETNITSAAKPVEITTDTKYRTPWHENEGQYFSLLKGFYTSESNAPLLQFLQTPIDLSPSSIRAWWARKQREKAVAMQAYLPERSQRLGSDLAAAHFIVYRGGAIKFFGESRWIKMDSFGNYALPAHYDGTKVLEAIDCAGMDIYYEGLSNLKNLNRLQWLSFRDCETVDDWCLDRVSFLFRDSLVYLDLRECPNFTYRGLGALCKMNKLKILYVDDIQFSRSFEMTCLMLQDLNPSLDIRMD